MLPIVFLHGIRVTGTMWRAHLEHYRAERPVAAPDLPGHGARADETFTLDGAVRATRDAIDGVGDRALLVGMSMGGYVAMTTAQRHPEKVAGLVIIGSTLRTQGAPALPRRLFSALGGRAGDAWQRTILRLMLGADAARDFVAGGLHTRSIPDVIAALARFDALEAVASYPGRTWVINGVLDHFRLDENAFLDAARDATLQHISRSGHLFSVSRPGLLWPPLDAALRALEGRVGRAPGR